MRWRKMDRKMLLRIAISIFFILLIGTISWQVIITPDKSNMAITKVEAEEIAQERYQGEITDSKETQESFIITIKSDTGKYEITISSDSGEVQNIVQTMKEELVTMLSEDEVKEIVLEDTTGEIKTITKSTENETDFYDADVENDQHKVQFKVNGETGEIVDKKKEPVTTVRKETNATKRNDNKQQEIDQETKQKDHKRPTEEKPKNIDEQEAIQIALNTVKGEVDDVNLESSNGQLYYFIEIETADDLEAEIQIHAITGEVISIEWDD